jgi:hypothetical protein
VSGPGALGGAGRLRIVGSRAGKRCVDGSAQLRFDSKRALVGQSLYAFVAYRVEQRSERPASIVSTAPARPGELALDAPRGQALVNLGRPLRVWLPPGARACARAVAVGWLGSNGR